MQRFRSVSFSKFEFEIAWAALAQASRLAGSGCMIRHCRKARGKVPLLTVRGIAIGSTLKLKVNAGLLHIVIQRNTDRCIQSSRVVSCVTKRKLNLHDCVLRIMS